MNCKFKLCENGSTPTGFVYFCEQCGRMTAPTPHPPERVYANCRANGFGDWVARQLTRIGITKERVAWAWAWSGFVEPECGCGERQEVLNHSKAGRLAMRAIENFTANYRRIPLYYWRRFFG